MRRGLYGSLAVLALLAGASVGVTGLTEGQCDIVCGWQWPFVLVGAGAGFAFVVVGIAAVVYEAWRRVGPSRQHR